MQELRSFPWKKAFSHENPYPYPPIHPQFVLIAEGVDFYQQVRLVFLSPLTPDHGLLFVLLFIIHISNDLILGRASILSG